MKTSATFFLLALLVFSCEKPGCNNDSNKILSESDINSWAYQDELMRKVEENPSNVEYYFERRAEIDGESFIVLNCFGIDFCGELKTKFVFKNLESVKLQNTSNRGAKLIGVGLSKVKLENGHEVLALEKLEKIVD